MSVPAKVSIIIPVYNVEDYLPKCLDSCINQTLYDIEIICVNDGSTDCSLRIGEHFAVIDPRIQIIDQENKGLASARNAGIRAANGQWIMFLDSDDFLSENACERIWLESQHEKTDVVIFGSEIFPVYPEVDHWYKETLYTGTHRFYEFDPYILFHMPGGKPFVWRQAFSSSLLKKLNMSFEEGNRYGEDLIFQFKTLPMAKNFSVISDRLYNYRWYREGSLMSKANQNLDYKMGEHVKMVHTITEYWAKNDLLDLYGTDYYTWVLQFMVPALHKLKQNERAVHAQKLRQIIEEYKLPDFAVVKDMKDDDKRLAKMLEKM